MLFVFASITMVNANSSSENLAIINDIILDDGSPSACVQSARNATLALAEAFEWDVSSGGSEFEFAMEVYMIMYLDCLNN